MERGHMHALGHPHGAAHLGERELDAEASECLNEPAHRASYLWPTIVAARSKTADLR